MKELISFVLIALIGAGVSFADEDETFHVDSNKDFETDTCAPPVEGIKYLLKQRSNFGWGENTHRNVIVLFLKALEGQYSMDNLERELMISELNLQLSSVLMKNSTNGLKLSPNDLSLYIHALLIVGENPKNFKGINLVKMLEENSYGYPLSILCLCNANALQESHLNVYTYYLQQAANVSVFQSSMIERIAIVALGFGCAESRGLLNENRLDLLHNALHHLSTLRRQDGSFGNTFTTSLIVQALKTRQSEYSVIIYEAKSFLKDHKPNTMIGIYYTELALSETLFIKDLLNTSFETFQTSGVRVNDIEYSLKVGSHPSVIHTIKISVPAGISIFNVMQLAAEANSKFNFSYSLQNQKPFIYSIDNLPNNAEENTCWRLFDEVAYNRRSEILYSVQDVIIQQGKKYVHWYLDADQAV